MLRKGLAKGIAGIGAAAFCIGQVAGAAVPDQYLCGVDDVEDLVALPGSSWIIGSGMGDRFFQKGALHLIDENSGFTKRATIRMAPGTKPAAPYDRCPGPVAEAEFSAHGLNINANPDGTFTLFVVNHGGRESVEVFRVAAAGAEPTFDWVGCVPTPGNAMPNSIALHPDGTLYMSAAMVSDKPMPGFAQRAREAAGQERKAVPLEEPIVHLPGAVFSWTRAGGWKELPNGRLIGNNGFEISKTGDALFVDSWPDASVTYMPLGGNPRPRAEIKLSFHPDNIRWSADGKLVAAGHTGPQADVLRCVVEDTPDCPVDYRVAEIDPQTFEVRQLFDGKGDRLFGVTTTGLKTDRWLWLGAVRSSCVARVRLPAGG